MQVVKQLRRMLGLQPSMRDERLWWDQFTWAVTQMTSQTTRQQHLGQQLLTKLARTAPSEEDRALVESVLNTPRR